MNAKEVQTFVMRYLEATDCHITEKSPHHVTVKLSPEADKDLTNRTYYWSFVERTGAPPETMTLTFVFDPEARAKAAGWAGGGPGAGPFGAAGGATTQAVPGAAGGPGGGGPGAIASGAASPQAAGAGAAGPAAQVRLRASGRASGPATGAAAAHPAQGGSATGAAGGTHPGAPTATEPPASGQTLPGQPGSGQSSAGQPGSGQSGAGQPASGPPGSGHPAPGQPAVGGDSILGRYFGFAPAPGMTGRAPFDEVTYGSRRLEQLFGVVRQKGRYVQMYEDLKPSRNGPPAVCQTWLVVNYKVEFCCDMKRDELHSLGISLMTGDVVEDFCEAVAGLTLKPRLPANTLVQRPVWSIPRAVAALEAHLEKEIRQYNHDWAVEAKARLEDELARVDAYYGELLPTIDDPEQRAAAEEQYAARKREIEWQYAPRIAAGVVSAGFFHIGADTPLLSGR